MEVRTFAALLALVAAPAFAQSPNLLSMAEGAVVLSAPQYDGGKWAAFNLFDGDAKTGWSSPTGSAKGSEIVIELPRRHRLSKLSLDASYTQESSYPGISARNVELWVSTKSPKEGWRKVSATEIPRAGKAEVMLPGDAIAEWVKLVVVDNWGNAQFSELMEVEAHGTPDGPPPTRETITGAYATNYGPMHLSANGGLVTGCYYSGAGRITGSTDGRVLQLEWRQDGGKRSGAVLMVLARGGQALNGMWYENGALQGTWSGQRDASLKNNCGPAASSLAADIAATGRAIAYGIRFATDSDKLTPESEPVLKEVADLMTKTKALKLSVQGHTDATNTDTYNMDLSQRRARAVVAWLVKSGIAADRLVAEGFGKTRPVADNATPQGRALNRRVELAAVK